ncbi:MAG: type II secretion system protein [Dehalococcoidales bacterium]|nr:type II secretion system protein [Dehalococcoidales bacterium]
MKMRIPRRDEKGFTLIELLIVVAILGVLAAVVIPNVGRFIGRGKTEAAATEFTNIQSALISMMVDNNLSRLPVIRDTGNATSDMANFPGVPYMLYGMSVDNQTTNYVATQITKGTYSVDALGTVNQTTTGY